jgi:hypothetical protein
MAMDMDTVTLTAREMTTRPSHPDRMKGRAHKQRQKMPHPTRLALSALLFGLAIVSGMAAFAASLGRQAPEAALATWPPNGDAYARVSTLRLAMAADPEARDVPRNLPDSIAVAARRGLELEPTNVSAIRNLAFYEASYGRMEQARALMNIGLANTRRDSGVNLWLTGRLLREGRQAEALQLYDTTIRTDTGVATTLMLTMAQLLNGPEALDSLEALLATNPPWIDDFWTTVLSTPGNLNDVYKLRRRLLARGVKMADDHNVLLIERLANASKTEEAFTLYETISGSGGDREILANGEFTAAAAYPPIGWKVVAESAFGSSMDKEGGGLQVTALPGAQGVVAQQLVRLRGNGAYVARADYTGADRNPLTLELACAANKGAETLDQSVHLPSGKAVEIYLTGSCEFAWVSLILPASTDGGGRDIRVDSVSLRRKP